MVFWTRKAIPCCDWLWYKLMTSWRWKIRRRRSGLHVHQFLLGFMMAIRVDWLATMTLAEMHQVILHSPVKIFKNSQYIFRLCKILLFKTILIDVRVKVKSKCSRRVNENYSILYIQANPHNSLFNIFKAIFQYFTLLKITSMIFSWIHLCLRRNSASYPLHHTLSNSALDKISWIVAKCIIVALQKLFSFHVCNRHT